MKKYVYICLHYQASYFISETLNTKLWAYMKIVRRKN